MKIDFTNFELGFMKIWIKLNIILGVKYLISYNLITTNF